MILSASSTIAPAMMALVVAIAGMMLPAISLHRKRVCISMPKALDRRLLAHSTKSTATSSSLSNSSAPWVLLRSTSAAKLCRKSSTVWGRVQTVRSSRESRARGGEEAEGRREGTSMMEGGARDFHRSSMPRSFSMSATKSCVSTCWPSMSGVTSATAFASSFTPKSTEKRCFPHTMQWIGLSGVERMVHTGKPFGAGFGSQS
mmetsp:Transcript_46576/g.110364  ORF Transcript_46576/g.110364 Transcript_46576/m.110364 type:complete len:203 (-) Transcript_46576:516-1124(-)